MLFESKQRGLHLDPKKSVCVQSKSAIFKFKGIINNRMIIKQVDLVNGILRVNVTNQISEEFKLVTPYSQLTCTECDLWVISDKLNGDQFIKESGYSQVWNSSMNRSIELVSDSTLISQEKVDFEQFKTTIMDVQFLESLMLDADEKTQEYKRQNHKIQTSEIITNIVVIKLKNAANVEREIILTYTQ